ncbi:hypothetical protein AJ79_00959 [Helicocarpus griseus UAMH5409]|uniref:RNA helicase HEL117 n=1 Tax=Helicocarpus griseus UAMH5409 TaxID=1447875 RepID=A0A2B7YA64_9EURO|nr:hypothetical protein AJ79_00959 [Helicocarpus griseus UAMH5409]
MDVPRHRHDDNRTYRSRSRTGSQSRMMSTSRSPVSEHPRRRRRRHRRDHRDHHRSHRHSHDRSRSPERKSERRSRREYEHERTTAAASVPAATLPFGARPLSKHDLRQLEPMFALYLDIQKNIDIAELDEREVKGRWKSFVGKWNRGELAEGWYDPSTYEKAQQSSGAYADNNDRSASTTVPRASPDYSDEGYDRSSTGGGDNTSATTRGCSISAATPTPLAEDEEEDEDEEESYGPKLPTPDTSLALEPSTSRINRAVERSGPTIPSMQDLQLQRESEKHAHSSALSAQHKQTTLARAAHKAHLRSMEEEVAPRAEPGTRERRLEKKREASAANRAFAEAKGGGDVDGIRDEELMGGGGGGDDLAALKREKEREARKKNEREIRREEMLRARAAEREERLKSYRKREEETMSVLKALAKQRFG